MSSTCRTTLTVVPKQFLGPSATMYSLQTAMVATDRMEKVEKLYFIRKRCITSKVAVSVLEDFRFRHLKL